MNVAELEFPLSTGLKLTKADAGRIFQITGHNSKVWRELPAEAREAWNTNAVNFPFTNKFGDSYTGSGFQCFMSLNNNGANINAYAKLTKADAGRDLDKKRTNIYASAFIYPPNPAGPFCPPIAPPEGDPNGPLCFSIPGGLDNTVGVLVFCCKGTSKGKAFRKGTEKLLGFTGFTNTLSFDCTEAYIETFGAIRPGELMFFRFVPISYNTGQAGVSQLIPLAIKNIALVPKTAVFTNNIIIDKAQNNVDWIVPFRAFGANLTDDLVISTPIDPAGRAQISRNLTGPWVNSISEAKELFGMGASRVYYFKFNQAVSGAFNTGIQVNSALAGVQLINVTASSAALVLAVTPNPIAFGDQYLDIDKVLEILVNAQGLTNNVNFAIGGADGATFKISESIDGPFSESLTLYTPTNGQHTNKKLFVKHHPNNVGAKVGVLAFISACGGSGAVVINANDIAGALTSPMSPGYDIGNNAPGVEVSPDFQLDGIGLASNAVVSVLNMVNCTVQISDTYIGPHVAAFPVVPVLGVINAKQVQMWVTPTAVGAFSWDVQATCPLVPTLTLSFTGTGV
jgi:hypothetical protein